MRLSVERRRLFLIILTISFGEGAQAALNHKTILNRFADRFRHLLTVNGYKRPATLVVDVDDSHSNSKRCWKMQTGLSDYRQRYSITGCLEESIYLPDDLTEVFVSSAILNLKNTSGLNLRDKIFGPDGLFQLHNPLDQRIYDVTIDHLLRHTSGIKDLTYDSSTPRNGCHDIRSNHQWWKRTFAYVAFDKNPGYAYGRCAICYHLLCEVIRKYSGDSCHDYIAKNIIAGNVSNRKWKRSDCGWYGTISDFIGVLKNRLNYDEDGKPALPYPQHKHTWPGYGIRFSARHDVWSESYDHRNDGVIIRADSDPVAVTVLILFEESRSKMWKPLVAPLIKQLLDRWQ